MSHLAIAAKRKTKCGTKCGIALIEIIITVLNQSFIKNKWRIRWDSNPRDACTPAGFQDRCCGSELFVFIINIVTVGQFVGQSNFYDQPTTSPKIQDSNPYSLTIVPEIGSVTPNSGEISASVGRIVSRNLMRLGRAAAIASSFSQTTFD